MEVMREAAKKMGLILSTNNGFHTDSLYNHSVSDVSLRINTLLKGVLPAENLNYKCTEENHSADLPFSLTDIQYAYLIGRNAAIPLGGIPAVHYTEIEVYKSDITMLRDALNHVVIRHPMMRAELTDGGRQRITPADRQYSISVTDCSKLNSQSVDDAIQATRTAMMAPDKMAENELPFNIHATLMPKENIRLHLCFNLMFFDLHSINIITRDWWAFYKNPKTNTIERTITFSDYLSMDKEIRESQRGETDKSYWRSKIKDLPSAPELPVHRSPELIKNPVVSTLKKEIPLTIINKLRQEATRNGITLEVLFLGIYTEVLRQWSRRQEFTLTLTQHSRRGFTDDVNSIVGNFLQPCLLSVKNSPGDTLTERLINLQTELLLNRWHSSFNGIQVLREMTRLSNDGRVFSLPVVFSNTLNAELWDVIPDHGWDGTSRVTHTATRTPGVWLENQLMRINGELVMSWNYVEDLFPQGMVEDMFDSACHLLCACAEEPSIWSQQYSVVPLPEIQQQSRLAANATGRDIPPLLLHESLLTAAYRNPEKIAVIQGNREISYRQLVATAYNISDQLRSQVNITPGDIIAVSMLHGPEMLAAILAVLITGAAYVSVDPKLPGQRKKFLVERCKAKAILGSGIPANTTGIWIQVPTIVSETISPLPPFQPRQSVDDLAYVIFTSGSTGEPKGVMITHHNASNTIADINHRFNVGTEDRVFSIAPAGFDLSVYDYFGVLGAGGSLLFAEDNAPADPERWAELVLSQRVTLWNSVPAPVKALFERAGSQLKDSHLRLILMSGDWIPVDLPKQIHSVSEHIDVISLGGATEGSIWSIVYPVQAVDSNWKSIPYGKPLANQRFHVMNEWLDPCPDWVTGELFIAGEGVAKGYLGDNEKTQARFFNHPRTNERLYRTGDLGRYINDGLIEILGREDNQVKINGYRIELGEIEAALLAHPSASHVVINAVIHPKTGQKQLAAYVVAENPDSQTLEGELRETATAALPSYMVPTWFVLLQAMPLTPNGKIDRNALPTVWADSTANDRNNTPANETETILYSIWVTQLQHNDFSVTDGFFDIGGDSLHAVSLLSAVRKSFSVDPSSEQDMIESLFMNASVRDFSKILAKIALVPKEPQA